MNVKAGGKKEKSIGFLNDGYWGMDVKKQTYTGSFWVKGAYKGKFTASLRSNLTEDVFGSVDIKSKSVANDWTEHKFQLIPKKDAPNSNNTFAITFNPKVRIQVMIFISTVELADQDRVSLGSLLTLT